MSQEDGWIEWNGGECPVEKGAPVDVCHRDGELYFGHKALTHNTSHYAASDWHHQLIESDIIAYRVVSHG